MPAGSTYSTIATTTLGSAASSFTFNSIPSTYTDLILIANGRSTSGSTSGIFYTYNGSGGTAYSRTTLYGNGTSIAPDRTTNSAYIDIPWDGGGLSTVITQIQNYANTTNFKTALFRPSTGGTHVFGLTVGIWRNTSAITSITLVEAGGGTFATGSTFTLYGIAAA